MIEPSPCLKCGSSDLIRDAEVLDQFGTGKDDKQPLQAELQSRPGFWFMKISQQADLKATVCRRCGFVELFVADTRRQFEAALEQTPERDPKLSAADDIATTDAG